MVKVIPISSIICNNIKPLKATEERIELDGINLFSNLFKLIYSFGKLKTPYELYFGRDVN